MSNIDDLYYDHVVQVSYDEMKRLCPSIGPKAQTENELTDSLSPEQFQLFMKYEELCNESICEMCLFYFRYGYEHGSKQN